MKEDIKLKDGFWNLHWSYNFKKNNLISYGFLYQNVYYAGTTSNIKGFLDKVPPCQDDSLETIQAKMGELQVNNFVSMSTWDMDKNTVAVVYPANATIIEGLNIGSRASGKLDIITGPVLDYLNFDTAYENFKTINIPAKIDFLDLRCYHIEDEETHNIDLTRWNFNKVLTSFGYQVTLPEGAVRLKPEEFEEPVIKSNEKGLEVSKLAKIADIENSGNEGFLTACNDLIGQWFTVSIKSKKPYWYSDEVKKEVVLDSVIDKKSYYYPASYITKAKSIYNKLSKTNLTDAQDVLDVFNSFQRKSTSTKTSLSYEDLESLKKPEIHIWNSGKIGTPYLFGMEEGNKMYLISLEKLSRISKESQTRLVEALETAQSPKDYLDTFIAFHLAGTCVVLPNLTCMGYTTENTACLNNKVIVLDEYITSISGTQEYRPNEKETFFNKKGPRIPIAGFEIRAPKVNINYGCFSGIEVSGDLKNIGMGKIPQEDIAVSGLKISGQVVQYKSR